MTPNALKLVVEGDNEDQRAEGARRAVGCIFGPRPQNGPLRMAPEFIRRLLQEDWPQPSLQISLRPPKAAPGRFAKEQASAVTELAPVHRITLNRMEIYETEFRHIGSALWLTVDDLRTLAAWEQVNAPIK